MKKLYKLLTVVLITTNCFAQQYEVGQRLDGGIIFNRVLNEVGYEYHIVSLSDLHHDQYPEYEGEGFLFSYQDACIYLF